MGQELRIRDVKQFIKKSLNLNLAVIIIYTFNKVSSLINMFKHSNNMTLLNIDKKMKANLR
jgi:hypothetical protein